jgi:hypothetical protein
MADGEAKHAGEGAAAEVGFETSHDVNRAAIRPASKIRNGKNRSQALRLLVDANSTIGRKTGGDRA